VSAESVSGRAAPGDPVSSSESRRIFGEPSEVDRPIFIVGCPRSGTSILRVILDSHPRISSGREEATLYWLERLDSKSATTRRGAYGLTEEAWHELVRQLVGAQQMTYAQSQHKTRWALKFPELALTIPWIDKIYPDSQVIHIVRDPRDVIASSHRLFGKDRTINYGERWVRYIECAERDGRYLGAGRFKTIRYEDLVTTPEPVLRELLEWLGERWNDDVLWPYGRTHEYPVTAKPWKRKESINAGSVGKGRGNTGFLPLLYVWLAGKDLLAEFGYDVSLTELLHTG
jgi:Sulfotransferase family